MDRLAIIEKLGGRWWELDKHVAPADVATFLWVTAQRGTATGPAFFEQLRKHVDAAHADAMRQFFNVVNLGGLSGRGWYEFDDSLELLIEAMAKAIPDVLKDCMNVMSPVCRDFALMHLVVVGAEPALDDAAALRFAGVLAGARHYADWMGPLRDAESRDWEALMLEAVGRPDFAELHYEHIEAFADRATAWQALAIVQLMFRPRSVATQLFASLKGADIDLVESELAELPSEFSTKKFRGAVGTMAALARVRAGEPVSDVLLACLADDLELADHRDLEPLVEVLGSLPPFKAEHLIMKALKARRPNRAISVAYLAPTDAVFDRAVELAGIADEAPEVAMALAAFGPAALDRIVDLANGKGAGAAVAAAALGRLGEVAAAPLVELLGHSAKGVRTQAFQSLVELGGGAHAALEHGSQARKRAVREACEALLAALDAPLAISVGAVPSEVRQLFDDMRNGRTVTVDQILALRPQHGLVVLDELAKYTVEHLDWSKGRVFTSIAREFLDEPGAGLILIGALARLPKESSYVIDPIVDIVRLGMLRDPEASVEALSRAAGEPGQHRDQLLRMLRESGSEHSVDIFYGAMSDSSKAVRAEAVEGAVSHPKVDPNRLVAMLSERKKDSRLAAAEALARIDVSGVLPALAEALETEKVAAVRSALEMAIAAQGGSAYDVPAETAGAEEVDQFLQSFDAGSPSFLEQSTLTLIYATGESATESAVRGVVARLAKEDGEFRDDVVPALAARFDAASLDRLSASIYSSWLSDGAPSKEKWALYQVGSIGVAARLDAFAPEIDELGSVNHHHARWCLETLARHGSPHAHAWLAHWARHAERNTVVEKATELLARAATQAGLDVEVFAAGLNPWVADDVADARVPTLRLDEPWTIDYGERLFEVLISANHELLVRDMDSNKLTTSLPRPRKAEMLSTWDKTRFSQIKIELRRTVKDVSARLEAAMVAGRRWTAVAFLDLFATHPVLAPFAGRLVFATAGGASFRFSDGEAHDVNYDAVRLDSEIWIAHRLDLEPSALEAWGQHFAEAEIFEPFPQLTRPMFDVTHALTGSVTRVRLASRLKSLGWRNGMAEDGGVVYEATRLFPGFGVRAWIEHEGFFIAEPSWDGGEPITFAVTFSDLAGESIAAGDVDPRVFSEVALDVVELTR